MHFISLNIDVKIYLALYVRHLCYVSGEWTYKRVNKPVFLSTVEKGWGHSPGARDTYKDHTYWERKKNSLNVCKLYTVINMYH